ncbi:helix-turn-helix domain-containing protein [Brochothrix thermosphacta]|uniref:helix-turn-helix domain-containing protein n=1 Tax=Brochothrix thermosphacta TaxID=2756 RepID=UPI000D79EBA0|nr:helix-turn-helix domain-containing protein [Brochothrix thermosphacta]SPN75431.1 conserved hypothetical protein [Brochothrix thermosphacta]
MHKLLDKQEDYSLQCLRYFSKKRMTDDISFQKMMEDLEWSRRTLIKNLDTLQDDIVANNWSDYLNFTYTAANIHLELSSLFSIDYFVTHYLVNNVQFEFCLEIFNDEFDSLQTFTENNFLTKATMYRKLNRLKELLQDFDITIDLTKSERMLGDEHQIRYFYYCLFSDAFHFLTDFAHNVEPDVLTDLINKIHSLHPEMPYAHLLKMRTYLAVTLSRINQGYILDSTSPIPLIESIIILNKDIKIWIGDLLRKSGLNEEQITAEINVLHFITTVLNIYPLEYFERVNIPIERYSSDFSRKSELFMKHFNDFFNQSLTASQYFYLLINLTAFNAREAYLKGSEHNSRMQINLQTVRESHPLIYSSCEAFFEYLEEQTGKVISNSMRIQYFMLLREPIRLMYQPIKICLLSKISDAQHVFLEKIISKSSQVAITFVPFPEESVDLYISDFKVNHLEKRYTNAVFYYWSSIPEETEWVTLLDILHRTYHLKGKNNWLNK